MSTDLHRDDGIILNRFYGGHARGTCYQITENGTQRIGSDPGVVQITTEQAMRIYAALGDALEQDVKRSIQVALEILDEFRGVERGKADGE